MYSKALGVPQLTSTRLLKQALRRQRVVQGSHFHVVSYLPASNAQKEAQDIGLLLLLKLFHVLELYQPKSTTKTDQKQDTYLERTHVDVVGGFVIWSSFVVVVSKVQSSKKFVGSIELKC